MQFLHTVRWKMILSVVVVAMSSIVAAAIARDGLGDGAAIVLAMVVAAAGGYWVAAQVEHPVHTLLEWTSHPAGRPPRITGKDEWRNLSDAITTLYAAAVRRGDQAEAERAHLRAVMDTMADGVLVADSSTRIQLANRAALAMFRDGGGDPAGRTVLEFTISVPLDATVRKALETGTTNFLELELMYPQQRQVRAVVSAAGTGADRAAVMVLHDITDRVRLERIRRDFVANVSHELRTPVTGILTMAENLANGAMEDPSVARHFLGHILDSSRRLVSLVDDLLALARAESGRALTLERVALANTVIAVVSELEHSDSARRVSISTHVPTDLQVLANADSLRQIITNLLDNAIKYSPEGGAIEVSAEALDSFAVLRVADHGIGIAPEDHARIFERFYRVDRARSREIGGTGLGLSIVKHLIDSLGGTVEVESSPGKGSVFSVRLPRVPE
jgi:two-component system phosphate regulon sensor histidine kinase PhoR